MVVQDDNATAQEVTDMHRIPNNTMYTAEFDYGDIGFGTGTDIRKDYASNLYVRLSYEPISDVADGNEISLSGAESMSKLELVCVQLFELK